MWKVKRMETGGRKRGLPGACCATAVVLLAGLSGAPTSTSAAPARASLEQRFSATVRPFLEGYCLKCHGGDKPKGDLDLTAYKASDAVVRDFTRWNLVLEKLTAKEMPPEKAKQPDADARAAAVAWIEELRRSEARKHAGDPGTVLARRLSNAEYNYTIRDLTGVDIRPTREFPVDPTNPAGFDNSGESLAMSPALMGKYLQAARDVANHLVLRPEGLAFAPHPVLVETDRDKYCVQQIVDFYHRHDTDYAHYFQAAWRYKHRAALGKPRATLAEIAAQDKLSPKYLATIWRTLEGSKETLGPVARLQAMWRALPPPRGRDADGAAEGSERMRGFVVELRRKLEPRFAPLTAGTLRGTAQPFAMWRNREFASHRMTYDRGALQIEGEARPVLAAAPAPKKAAADDDVEEDEQPAQGPSRQGPDADLRVPAGDRARYEAAFARFAAAFPDAFYVQERGRNYLDPTKDRGRLLSAGFHNLMGYFRDDQPLVELVLDERGRKELDELWRDLDYVASATLRTYTQFYLSESGQARAAKAGEAAAAAGKEVDITSEAAIKRVEDSYLVKAGTGNAVAIKAIREHFAAVNATLRWVERAHVEAEPKHLEALLAFASRAYRRPLARSERDDLLAYYRSLRDKGGLDHDQALRDSVVSVLMSPDFCYRIDLVEAGGSPSAGGARPLSEPGLASRLSYFLWSSMPDQELLVHAAAGDLHRPAVLVAQVRRMLKDPRSLGLVTEFGGNWLDFRRFEELNTVDRERFPGFDDQLRAAMFEEPIRFMGDVVRNDRSVLDLLYGKHTFVNAALAKHYGMSDVAVKPGEWVRVEDARRYGRGGLLPMSVFLTKNAPGLRTSPVKRGYWLVRRVLGEQIPPPPAVVPELPHDEAKLELPLREVLARHREDPSCASCHARFDAFGLAFEGYGPIGETRTKDLAGRPVDARAEFPGGASGTGLEGLHAYLRGHRQEDFVDNLCRKLLGYALGRSLVLSDEPTLEKMRAKLKASGYRFGALVEDVVQSPQFLTKRGVELAVEKGR
jgi:hypothetical protein